MKLFVQLIIGIAEVITRRELRLFNMINPGDKELWFMEIVGDHANIANRSDQEDVIAFLVSFGCDGWISSHDHTDEKTEVCLFSPSGMTVVFHRDIYGPWCVRWWFHRYRSIEIMTTLDHVLANYTLEEEYIIDECPCLELNKYDAWSNRNLYYIPIKNYASSEAVSEAAAAAAGGGTGSGNSSGKRISCSSGFSSTIMRINFSTAFNRSGSNPAPYLGKP